MAQTFNTISFEEQLSILEDCSKWMAQVGIDVKNTRFEKVLNLLRIIVEHYRQDKISELMQKYNEATLFYVLTDATSFMEIYLFLKNKKSHEIPRKKLTESISGPILPLEEEPNKGTAHSRNIVFELETAALFHKEGFEIIHLDDVQFLFDNNMFNIQCKRIHSPKRIEDNIKEAASQISKRMNNESNVKGIIFLCIDKLTEKENHILNVDHVNEIGPHMGKLAYDFITTYKHLWKKLININILGTVVFVNILASINQDNKSMLTTCKQRMLDIIPEKEHQHYNYLLIKNLSAKLEASRNNNDNT